MDTADVVTRNMRTLSYPHMSSWLWLSRGRWTTLEQACYVEMTMFSIGIHKRHEWYCTDMDLSGLRDVCVNVTTWKRFLRDAVQLHNYPFWVRLCGISVPKLGSRHNLRTLQSLDTSMAQHRRNDSVRRMSIHLKVCITSINDTWFGGKDWLCPMKQKAREERSSFILIYQVFIEFFRLENHRG